ncbi:MAG TPA: SpoIIE family protein phosphatase [Aggregatilineales bacterium]|nr:SpoIIE family protein phosphatase [Aggregatilineales bacterium]HPV05733.1 SpoIIE family protein phosphatase [Aggregatilineales bacterium]HQA66897.1 SpoIIE family protein phosphatase [Aggregatilineales bacterium]HQE17352.1 SpoIIE family protein phosphatase [Aggregatilineales bacterium]
MAVADVDLEALVGHLFIVGGRMISAASPGAIATPPPRRVARGRDADSFFGLVSLAPGEHQPAVFYEALSDEITGTYFNTSGSITSALRTALSAASEHIYRANRRSGDYATVGLACAVLRGSELYVAISGPARAFLVQPEGTRRMPGEFELAEPLLPLGAEHEPDVRLYHYDVQPGDFLILADPTFSRLTDNTVRQATSTGEIADTLNNLATVASENCACEVIKFVTPLPEEAPGAVGKPKRRRLPALPLFPRGDDEPLDDAEQPEPVQSDGAAERQLRRAGQSAARGLARVVEALRVLVERWLPEGRADNPLEERFQLSTAAQLGIALGVALSVALLTTVIYTARGQTSEYAQLVREAQAEIERGRAGGSQAEARAHWEYALFYLNEAAKIRQPSEEILALRNEALAALDAYDHTTRVEPLLLRAYNEGSTLIGPVVHGLNLYVADATQGILYREDLDESGAALTNRSSRVVAREGEVIDGRVVGEFVDMTWLEDGGVGQRNVLAVLTANGQLITYSPSWDVTVNVLPGADAWGSPRAVAVFERDLYVLDAGANEIWRYVASADTYAQPPQRYFTDVTPDLSNAVDMAIDSNGNVYVLHADGQISKYFAGRQEAFVFEGLPQPVVQATALFLTVSPYDRTLYMADPGGGRIYTLALNGTFLSHYRDFNDAIFDGLTGLYNVDRPPYVYVTAGNRLYYFSRP